MLRRWLARKLRPSYCYGSTRGDPRLTGGSITSDGLLNDTLFGFGGPTLMSRGSISTKRVSEALLSLSVSPRNLQCLQGR